MADTRVEIRAFMRPDGTVDSAEILNRSSNPVVRSAEEAALRAVENPACQPLPLPPNRYNDWQVIVLEFAPRDMF